MNEPKRTAIFILLFLLLFTTWVQGQTRRHTAILPFTNQNGAAYDWLSRGIDEILYDKMGNLEAFSLFEKTTLTRLLKQKKIYTIDDLTLKNVFALRKESGVDIVVAGYYEVADEQNMELNFRVLSAYTGAPIFNRSYNGPIAEIYTLIYRAITEMMESLALPLSEEERMMLAKSSTTSAEAFRDYCQAYTEFQKGSSMEVVAGYFTRALEKDPDFWEAQYNLGVIYYNFDRYEKALQQFRAVIQKNPNFYKPYYGIGVIYYLQRRYNEARENFKKVLNLNPNHDRSLYYMGRVYVRLDSLEKALEYLAKSASLNPNYAPTQFQLGLTNMQRGWYKSAVVAFKKAIKLDPDNYRAHNALGECYYRLQRFDEAIFHYKRCIQLKPEYSTAYFNLGNTIYKRGALQEIVSAYLEILETRYAAQTAENAAPGLADELRQLKSKETSETAVVYQQMISAYRNALKHEPGFYEAAFNLALTYENIGRPDSAEYFYKQSLNANPNLVRAHMRLGRLYEKQGRYTEALNQFKEVVKIEPEYFSATPRLGENYRYINIIETVLSEYQNRYDLNPRQPEVLLVLGRIYRSLGRYGQAREYFQKTVELDPQNREATLALKELQRRQREL